MMVPRQSHLVEGEGGEDRRGDENRTGVEQGLAIGIAGTIWAVIRPIGQTRRHMVRRQAMLEELEELESIRAFDLAKASGERAIPFEQAIQEIERERG